MGKLWTQEENELIVNGVNDGLNYKQIAELLPHRAYRSVAVQGNKLLGALKRVTPWTEEQTLQLIELRDQGLSIPEIAEKMGRTYDNTKSKLSQLIKKGTIDPIGHQNGPKLNAPKYLVQELNQYVLNYPSRDNCPQPWASRIVRHYGSWTVALQANNLQPNCGGVMHADKPTTLYLLNFGDFCKIGITQRELKQRFSGAPAYTVLDTLVTTLGEAREFEEALKEAIEPYKCVPDHPWFERNGKTECFVAPNCSTVPGQCQELKLADLL